MASTSSSPQTDRVRAFIGLEGFYSSIGGNFDGNKLVVADNNSQTILIPELENGGGVGGRLGVRRFSNSAVDIGAEVGFGWSRHSAKQGLWRGDATLLTADGNMLLYFNTRSRAISPYVSAGVTLPFLFMSEASFTITENESAFYSGYGFNLGAGIECMMGSHWAIQTGVAYKWMSMTNVSGVDNKRFRLDDPLDLSTFSPRIRVAWYF